MRSKNTQSAADDAAASLRKRKQNRISQQCLREKKNAASSSFFEQLSADVRALREGCERSGQVDTAELLAINEGLVEENRNLREALLRMRKKLLSLSSAADCAADDPIFQKMLAKEPETPAPDSNGNGVGTNKRRKYSSAVGQKGRSGSSDASVDEPFHRDDLSPDNAYVRIHGDGSDSMPAAPDHLGTEGQPDLSFYAQDMTIKETCPDFPGVVKSPNDLLSSLAFPIATLPQLSMPNSAVLDAWMSRSVGEIDGVKKGAVVRRIVERDMVERLAEIAVHLIFDDTGLGRWINTLDGAREFLKSVVTCRIMLGCATPTDVLDGLETDWPAWSTSTRPLIVDLIAWPSLRDQMIFHSSFYDLDEMTEDIINYTVADIPEQRIALQLYSRPPNPFPYVPRPDENTSDTPFKFSTNEHTLKILQIQNQELYDIISRRMEAPASGDGTDQPCFGIPGSPQSECIPAKTCTSKKFKGWKLSTIFFKKYPFLQCPSLSSVYPFCPASKISCS
ncbi:putative tRNA 2 -phosphotransferase 1 protein [Botryosphaeria dothidea]|uniref:tRNA 2 -phosphotransferase 1 protein n=1 Tax=Botryosphaeria dothidea TaxID=55169 RepID=A0A8H4IZQ6_9PEZI|nr:putative tRNA 2 -phosphotransferase 1 protein [Botryosphaeria dothidea]